MSGLLTTFALAAIAGGAHEDLSFVSTTVDVPTKGAALALRDMDGDGRTDLVRMDARGISVSWLGDDGRFTAENGLLDWPARQLAWDLTDLEGDGTFEVAMLLDGREVRVWRAGPGRRFDSGQPLVQVRCYLPRGLTNMDFARDVDGDGLEDLVLPGSGEYLIHLQGADDPWSASLRVAFEARIAHEFGAPNSLTSSFGQSVDIPWFRIEDIDGDGRRDLVSETGDLIGFHIASPGISEAPTWRLDLAALRAELPGDSDFDLGDVFSVVGRMVDWRVLDLDGEAPHDVVLRLGSTFKIYRDAARTGPARTPDQILKASGNTVWFFLRDVQGDPLPDLQLLRVEKLGLARILRWLVLPGSLDFDLYTYENAGGVFARRPTRRHGIALRFPRLMSLAEDIEEYEEELERQESIPARAFDMDGDGRDDDVMDVVGGELRIYRNRVPLDYEGTPDLEEAEFDELIESILLEDLDRLEDGAVTTIDLGDLESWHFSPGVELRELCGDASPDYVVPAGIPEADARLHTRDLDGDGRLDLVLIGAPDEGVRTLRILVRR